VKATLATVAVVRSKRGTVMKPKLGALVSWLPAPNDACSASFAIRFQYRGTERTVELPLAPHTIGQLAVEATIRQVTIGELIAELITTMVRNKDLIQQVLDKSDPATEPIPS
jgi:hypothetical protein